jgi:hypothetical protein
LEAIILGVEKTNFVRLPFHGNEYEFYTTMLFPISFHLYHSAHEKMEPKPGTPLSFMFGKNKIFLQRIPLFLLIANLINSPANNTAGALCI